MQVFWVYVCFFICIIITSFFRISVFSFNIRLIFLYVISLLLACSVPQSSSSSSSSASVPPIRIFCAGRRGNSGMGDCGMGKESLFKSSRSPFSLCVFLFSVRFVLTTHSLSARIFLLPLNYFMEDLLIDCCFVVARLKSVVLCFFFCS